MRIASLPGVDLTYCTNIYAGESWQEVFSSVAHFALPLKEALSPDRPFALGLRLSAAAAAELRRGDELERLRALLQENGLYVALINGFPYGAFHGERVKDKVFAPDWRDARRRDYTLDLVEILAALLPAGMDGGISTMPLSYKPWLTGGQADAWPTVVKHVVAVAARMAQIFRETGKLLHLDIEPEPNGLVESTAELIAFFEGPLRTMGEPLLASMLSLNAEEAHAYMRRHINVCFDTCHLAVEFEDSVTSLQKLQTAGIGIGRIQISSALRVPCDGSLAERNAAARRLQEFSGSVYLHQVMQRNADGTLLRYPDLEDALQAAQSGQPFEWRIHFHLPIFTESYGALHSTFADNRAVLQKVLRAPVTTHIEVETYTWAVLPEPLRMDLRASIERELRWVLGELCTRP